MRDRKLTAAIERDNRSEAAGEIPAQGRATCYQHQTWAEDCADQHAPGGGGRGIDERLNISRFPKGTRR